MYRVLAVTCLLLFGNGPLPQVAVAMTQATAAVREDSDAQKVAELEKARAETKKLLAEADKLRAEEHNLKNPLVSSSLQILLGLFTVAASVLVAAYQVSQQRVAQKKQAHDALELQHKRARVDALLKAAELAIDAPTTGMMRSRAEILSNLLTDLVPDFGKSLRDLDFTKVGFAAYRQRFMTLFESMAGSPDSAAKIAETYNILFPDDDEMSKMRITRLRQFLAPRPDPK